MATNNSQQSGSGPPPKPWERAGSSSGPAPFKPPSPGSTSDVVEASGTAKPGEIVTANDATSAMNRNALGRAVPARPWEQQPQPYGSTYGGGAGLGYNSGYGTGAYGGMGSTYNSGLYGNSMYRGGYGGLSGGGMYGGGMYGGGYGSSMGGYGMGGMGMGMGMGGMGMGMGMGGPGGPYGDEDPNNPFGPPSQPPGFWISLMRVMQGFVTFFGRVAMLIDQNAQAFHMFMSALLQLFDRSGLLYGELARFVFRILGVRRKSNKIQPPGPNGQMEGPPKAAPAGAWDGVWGNN